MPRGKIDRRAVVHLRDRAADDRRRCRRASQVPGRGLRVRARRRRACGRGERLVQHLFEHALFDDQRGRSRAIAVADGERDRHKLRYRHHTDEQNHGRDEHLHQRKAAFTGASRRVLRAHLVLSLSALADLLPCASGASCVGPHLHGTRRQHDHGAVPAVGRSVAHVIRRRPPAERPPPRRADQISRRRCRAKLASAPECLPPSQALPCSGPRQPKPVSRWDQAKFAFPSALPRRPRCHPTRCSPVRRPWPGNSRS